MKEGQAKANVAKDKGSSTITSFVSAYGKKLHELSVAQPELPDSKSVSVEDHMFKFRLANSDDGLNSASLLVQQMYSWRGYATSANLHHSPNRFTLLAFYDEKNIGTVTLGLDSEGGLSVDEMYGDKVGELRAMNRKVCEITKLAVDQSVRSKRVLATLFHLCFIYGRNIHGGTDFVIEVNPRHVLFYKRMLGFEHFGEEKTCPRVNAPAILLRLELDYAERKITEFGGQMEAATGEKSLYPFFFSKKDELGITGRLLRGN
ncbi:MAG: GNAT family N-acetyltransferase [Gallionellaceae bacterium]